MKTPANLSLHLFERYCSQTVINLLSTGAWRGVWNLLGRSGGCPAPLQLGVVGQPPDLPPDLTFSSQGGLFPGQVYTDTALTLPAALLANWFAWVWGPALQAALAALPRPAALLATRTYTAIYFTAYMLLWRSAWNILLGTVQL